MSTLQSRFCVQANWVHVCRALRSSQQEVSSLEQRLLRSEQAEAELSHQLRDAEAHAAEQEGCLIRATALEDRLKEYQAEHGQLDNYKQAWPSCPGTLFWSNWLVTNMPSCLLSSKASS